PNLRGIKASSQCLEFHRGFGTAGGDLIAPLVRSMSSISAPFLGHGFGAGAAPGGQRASAFSGLLPRNEFGSPLPKMQPWPWEQRASPASLRVPREKGAE